MKFLSIFFLLIISSSLQARELGEDPSNVECTNSIQKSRPHMALVKVEVKDDEIPEVKETEIKTISK
ncbi:MAG: hypothetical protein DRQ88_02980 [Epsilonproteobacteria bacterium]|nr:MAG: hypothetical protein DRQ89_01935 [Campylobacterota bacterium]RLA67436.1 MAG: hypothetical protein DRQ88_02980 [Campylobacterota bacterium]